MTGIEGTNDFSAARRLDGFHRCKEQSLGDGSAFQETSSFRPIVTILTYEARARARARANHPNNYSDNYFEDVGLRCPCQSEKWRPFWEDLCEEGEG